MAPAITSKYVSVRARHELCISLKNPAIVVRSHRGSLSPHKSPPRRGNHRYPAQGTAGRARAAYAAAGKDPVETPSPHAAATRIGRRQASAGVLPLTESNSVLWHLSRNRRLHCVCGTSMSIYQLLILSAPASQPQPQPLSLSLSLLASASAEAPAGRPAGQPAQT